MRAHKQYLITGGFGLIGSTLAKQLKGNVTLVSRSRKHIHRIDTNKFNVILKPIQKLSVEDIKDVDIIYHCASTVDNYNILTDPYIDVETNITGTIHLLELCKELKKKPKIVYFSTFFVYGNTYENTNKKISETSATNPLAIYPATKLCTESIIKSYHAIYDIPYLIVRLTNVYGETEDFNNKKKGALNWLIMQAVMGNELPIYKGGNFYRDYIHVDDVAKAVISLNSKSNDTYLIGYGKPVYFKQLIEYMLKGTGNKSKVKEIDPPTFHKHVGVRNFVANTAKLQKTGWKPSISPKEGINRVIQYYKTLV